MSTQTCKVKAYFKAQISSPAKFSCKFQLFPIHRSNIIEDNNQDVYLIGLSCYTRVRKLKLQWAFGWV